MIRIIMAIILGFAAVAVIWCLPAFVFDWVVLFAIIASLFEFGRIVFTDKREMLATAVVGALVALYMIFFAEGEAGIIVLLVAAVFLLSSFFMWNTNQMAGVAGRLALSTHAVIYLASSLSLWSWLRHLEFGRELVMLAIVPSCLCDTFAFFAGKAFGKRRLAPLVSPNKTQEGFLGALLGSLLGSFLIWILLVPFIPWRHVLIISLGIWIISPMGDLIESMIKRSSGVKDSGTIIPGHGGVLDRLDALTFTGAFMYFYIKYILQI